MLNEHPDNSGGKKKNSVSQGDPSGTPAVASKKRSQTLRDKIRNWREARQDISGKFGLGEGEEENGKKNPAPKKSAH